MPDSYAPDQSSMWDYYRRMIGDWFGPRAEDSPPPGAPPPARAVRIEELHPYKTAAHKAKVLLDLAKSQTLGDDLDPVALAGKGSRIPSPDLPQAEPVRTPFEGKDLVGLSRLLSPQDFAEVLAESMARQRKRR